MTNPPSVKIKKSAQALVHKEHTATTDWWLLYKSVKIKHFQGDTAE